MMYFEILFQNIQLDISYIEITFLYLHYKFQNKNRNIKDYERENIKNGT